MIICVQMMPELRRYIQHISLSPDSINNDDVSTLPLFSFVAALAAGRETPHLIFNETSSQAVSPLMKYLQDTMLILTENLVKENMTR